MDTTMSAAAVSRELHTTIPRVIRAIERLGLEARQDNGRMALGPSDAALLRTELGVSPPRVPGLTPTALKVLAALSRAPRGLTSARTVAQRAGVSPTAAGHAIDLLRTRGLVTVQRRTLPAGRARQFDLIRLDYASRTWQQLAGTVAAVQTPGPRRRPASQRVPARLRHLFWNTAPSQLDTRHAGPYIARRLLSTGDPDGLAWGLANLNPSDWRHAARTRGLTPRRRALALNFAADRNDDAVR
jgi:DNA-binding transcriptional ArsR family regulator